MSDQIKDFDISSLIDGQSVKKLNYDEIESLCLALRKQIIGSVSKNGGHLSPNLGVVELTVALHRVFDLPNDKLIFDVGHQSYVHKLLTGRSLEKLNQKDGISGFQKRAESVYDCYEAGHSSTSISAAEAFAVARDLKKENYEVVAVIGDASISNGLSFEALNDIGARRNKVIIVLNDNGMSIAKPVGGMQRLWRRFSTAKAYNKLNQKYRRSLNKTKAGRKFFSLTYEFKNFIKRILLRTNMFDNLGFSYLGPIDGHNVKTLEKYLQRAKNSSKPVIVHVLTKKGKGYGPAEEDRSGYWHGATPFDVQTGDPLNQHPGLISWSHYFSDLTLEMMQSFDQAELIVPATQLGSGLDDVFARFPERCLDLGIAEEHAATFSGALAINGIHPILCVYSTFLQRAYDEIAHDCARMNANMTILIDRAGLVGGNGETHQGIYDVAFLKSIPKVIVSMPSNKSIARSLYFQSFSGLGVFAIRFPRDMVLENEPVQEVELGELRWNWFHRSQSKKLAVIAVGPHFWELLNILDERKIEAEMIDPVYLNPINPNDLAELAKYERVFIYDAYGIKEGFAESVLSGLLEHGFRGKVAVRAVPNRFIPQASIKEQEEEFSLTPEQVALDLEAFGA